MISYFLPASGKGCGVLAFAFLVTVVSAQTMDAPPTLEVGNKWTFRIDDKGNRLEPYTYMFHVRDVRAGSAWMYGETQRPGSNNPKFVARYDQKRAGVLEYFKIDPAEPNSVGQRYDNSQPNDDWFQFPLAVGKKFNVREFGDRTTNEYKAEVEAFEKIRVEAGEFEAFRIRYSGWWTRNDTGRSGRVERVMWYAPAAKQRIRAELKDWDGSRLWSNRIEELVKWEPKAD
ncbi:MAG: hypothetical protein V4614_02595 [Pseudomonadota bacterium]